MENEHEEPKVTLAPPVGLCKRCINAMAAGTIDGEVIALPRGSILVGLFCEHNSTSATMVAHVSGTVGAWRMVSPVSRETFLGLLRQVAERGEVMQAEAASAELLKRFQAGSKPH